MVAMGMTRFMAAMAMTFCLAGQGIDGGVLSGGGGIDTLYVFSLADTHVVTGKGAGTFTWTIVM